MDSISRIPVIGPSLYIYEATVELWEWTKSQTSIYTSELEWKKASVACTIFKHTYFNGDTQVTLAETFSEYFSGFCDILTLQNQERNRNVLKFVCDFSSKLVPPRTLEQRGTCQKYPELLLEGLKLCIPTTDGIPQIQMTEKELNNMNTTCVYITENIPVEQPTATTTEVSKTKTGKGKGQGRGCPRLATLAAKRQRNKQAEPKEAEPDEDDQPLVKANTRKVGLNKLDIIERAVAQVLAKLAENDIGVKGDIIGMMRRKLLEFVMRGGVMTVQVVGGNKKKELKDLDSAVDHFVTTVYGIHAATVGCHIELEQPEKDDDTRPPVDEEEPITPPLQCV